MERYDVLRLAMTAGEIMLVNGGETYRVEDTIRRICKAGGLTGEEAFVTPTGIFLTVDDIKGEPPLSMVRRIPVRTIDLNKIARVNDFSRRFAQGRMTVQDGTEELAEIRREVTYNERWTLAASAVGAAASTMLLGGGVQDLALGAIVGFSTMAFLHRLTMLQTTHFLKEFVGGAFAAILALILVKFIGLFAGQVAFFQPDKIILGTLYLLVPGVTLTNAIRDLISGDLVAGVVRGIDALLVAGALAGGSGFVLAFWGGS
ncbi:threonine/serine exporter family protein [Heliobacterium mobile]|nr:threonine/serine exporter family protein [Heliobacterium mobile]